MAAVETFNSPADLQNYLNSITLPATYWIVDKGARYAVLWDEGAQYGGEIFYDESTLKAFLDATLHTIIRIVPHGEGGKFTFISPTDVAGGVNTYGMAITSDVKTLEDVLNTLTTFIVVEHDSKKVVYSTEL